MAGLLERFANWSEPLRSKSYYTDKRKQARADEVAGIIGQVGGSEGNGPLQPQGLLGQLEQPGLSGGITPEQFNTRLGAQVMGIPGYENSGTNILNQQAQNRQSGINNRNTIQGANDRYMYGQNNLSMDQRRQQGNSDRTFNAGRADQRFSELETVRRAYIEEAAPFEQSIFATQNVDNLVKEKGYTNLSGAENQAIISSFLKTIRPGEAQMEGDLKNLKEAFGFKGTMDDFFNKFLSGEIGAATGTGSFAPQIEQMHKMMQKQANMDQQRINETRSRMRTGYKLNQDEMGQVGWRDGTQYVVPTSVGESNLPTAVQTRLRPYLGER